MSNLSCSEIRSDEALPDDVSSLAADCATLAKAVKGALSPLAANDGASITTAKRRRVLVTSNCQTGGIELCLRAMLPDTDLHMLYAWQISPDAMDVARTQIKKADVWVTIVRDPDILALAEGNTVIRIPYLNFSAFHPDICYIQNTSGAYMRCAGDSDYHSMLAFWSFRSGLSLEQAKAMFRKEVYREIGYFDGWDASIQDQRFIFDDSDLSFSDFIRPLVSRVPFMHTPNHPDSVALGHLSKMIARQITGDESVMKLPIDYMVQDTLSHIATWPIYPEIAAQFGLQGCYIWKFPQGKFVTSLDEYLRETYAHYSAQDISGWVCARLENPELQNKLKTLAGL